MKKELVEIMARLLVADSTEKDANQKMDLILSKLEAMENVSANPSELEEHLLINDVCKLTRKSRVTIWKWSKTRLFQIIFKQV